MIMAADISHILKSCTINEARFHTIVIPENELEAAFDESAAREAEFAGQVNLTISKVEDENNVLFFINLKLTHQRERSGVLSAEKSVEFELNLPETEKVLGSEHSSPWWMAPQFRNSFDELDMRSQGALLKSGDEYIYLLPLNGDNCFCEFGRGRAYLSIGSLEYDWVSGPFLCVSRSGDPYSAVRNAFYFAKANGGIRGKLIEEKEWPRQLKGLGMCTWNMCYKDLTSEKIYAKLAELREKKIPVKWFLFDNGWLQVKDSALLSFKENRERIPEGLKECISRIKNEFGIEYVGLWHTFDGFEMGIHPQGELYEEQKQNLELMPGGTVQLSDDEQKAFAFWDSWHTYFEECGVDFVKVDSQSTYPILVEGKKSNTGYTRSNHKALEKSVDKHFGGAVINCMGMDMLNVLERDSLISRTSGDFDPEGSSERFYKHLYQNVWSCLWHGAMYVGDFDMFWSAPCKYLRHESVLRAISGGPIYLSDEIGISDYDNVRPCINEDGSLPLMEHCALPTRDIIFEDCIKDRRLIKVWNEKGGNFALALFAADNIADEVVGLDCIPGTDPDADYMVCEYFTGSKFCMKGSGSFTVSLNSDEVRAYSVMPVKNGEYDFFDDKLYFPFAGIKAEK